MANKMYRQGDVLLIKISQERLMPFQQPVPPAERGVVLAEGEATGHAHTMSAETTTKYSDTATDREWIVVDTPTLLTHEEHGTIEVAPGMYWVTIQREYTPQGVRDVID